MPTYKPLPRFLRDYAALTPEQRLVLKRAVDRFVVDLERGRFRAGLCIKGVQGTPGVYELAWAPDGRATFEYGTPLHGEEPHIIWRRSGSHAVLSEP